LPEIFNRRQKRGFGVPFRVFRRAVGNGLIRRITKYYTNYLFFDFFKIKFQ
jgi:hypothetical protein